MRNLVSIIVLGFLLLVEASASHAQAPIGGPLPVRRMNDSIGMSGLYGTSWGTASFGVPRTYSSFASPYGVGYGYGYPAYGFVPNQYGIGLWRPGLTAPGYTYGSANAYNTFPYPYKPGGPRYGPSIGVYAPGFGPGNGASLGSR